MLFHIARMILCINTLRSIDVVFATAHGNSVHTATLSNGGAFKLSVPMDAPPLALYVDPEVRYHRTLCSKSNSEH